MSDFNKPFDRAAKWWIDELPRLLLHLTNTVPLEADAEVKLLRTETSPPVKMPDFAAIVTWQATGRFVFHAEFELDWHSGIPEDLAMNGVGLATQHRLPVETKLILIRPDRVPQTLPEVGVFEIGKTTVTHPYGITKVWELDPTPVLESGSIKALPWVALMKSTDEQVRAVARRLAAEPEDEPLAYFNILGSVRYDRGQLLQFAGGRKMGLTEAILRGSSLVKEIADQASEEARVAGHAAGHAAGQAAGIEQGATKEARRILRSALAAKFAGLESMPEIDQITSVERLESLLINQVILSSDRNQVETAIRRAAE